MGSNRVMEYSKIYKMDEQFENKNRLNPDEIFRLFNEVANIHAEELGIGYDDMQKINAAWFIFRCKYQNVRDISETKYIKVKTWPKEPRKIEYDRDYIITNDKDEIVIRGCSKYAVINLETRTFKKENIMVDDTGFIKENALAEEFERILYNDIDNFKFVYTYQVQVKDIDVNNHMNNTAYVAMLNKLLKNDIDINEIASFQINYLKEARLNEKIKVYKKNSDDRIFILGTLEDESPSFVVMIKMKAAV